MKLKINTKYRFIIQVGSRTLNFTGLVISIDENFVEFEDIFKKIKNYNLKNIVSFEEVTQ